MQQLVLQEKSIKQSNLEAVNEVNKPYEITARIILSKDENFKPKFQSDVSVEVEFEGAKRFIKDAILWAEEQSHTCIIKENTGDRTAQTWIVKLRPKMYVLSQDVRSDVY